MTIQGPSHESHPEAYALQRYADGDIDPRVDRALVDHVRDCALCRDEVEGIRRVDAAIALSSQPPANLFAQLKARREAGERVELPVPGGNDSDEAADVHTSSADGHPRLEDLNRLADDDVDATGDAELIQHVEQCMACQEEIELARRGAAVIALASRAPDRAFDQLRARRSTGDRVLVVVPNEHNGEQSAVTSTPGRAAAGRFGRRRPIYAWSLAVAAALTLAVGLRVVPRFSDRSDGPPADSGVAFTHGPDSTRAGGDSVARARAWTSLRTTLNSVAVATPAMTLSAAERALVVKLARAAFADTMPTAATANALREIGTLLAGHRDYGITVRGNAETTTSAESEARRAALVRAVVSGLVAGGVEGGRVRVAAATAPDSLGVVEVEVTPAR